MGRITIRVPLYKAYPEKFIELMKGVITKHEELGPSSPLNDTSVINMDDFKQKLDQADALRKESLELRALSETKMAEARKIMGTAVGQNIYTEGTLYYLLEVIKKLLLAKYRGLEEELSRFGFNVVIGKAKRGGRKKKTKIE